MDITTTWYTKRCLPLSANDDVASPRKGYSASACDKAQDKGVAVRAKPVETVCYPDTHVTRSRISCNS